MRIEIAAFTDRGEALAGELAGNLRNDGDRANVSRCGRALPLRQWAADRFARADALIFVGSIGIAVRAVSPFLASKTSDPAVVVVDDHGRFAVALLSGHLGGANELAERVAVLIGAVPVVTTATDNAGVFQVDVWAKKAGLAIANPERIKNVSAKLLAGQSVGLRSAFPVAGVLPPGVVLRDGDADIVVDVRTSPAPEGLRLVPPAVVLGVGCRKNVGAETIDAAFESFRRAAGIFPSAFAKVCSADLKKDEPGLRAFCEKRSLPFETFSSDALAALAGEFTASDFVASVAGVDNVCERSAVAGSGGGELAVRKRVNGGVAMAAAVRAYTVSFNPSDGEGE